MRGVDLKALLPLYLVIFIGFCGYSLMITLFVPMLMGTNGFLAAEATTGQRSVVLGILLAIYPLGQFLGSPVLARCRIAAAASLSSPSHSPSRLPPTF
jgi:hypothetical protein